MDALERLIGGDTDVEIEIRRSVTENFAQRHLKALATAETIKNVESAIKKWIKDEFFTQVKEGSWGTKTVFKNEVVEQLKEHLKYEAKGALTDVVSELLETKKSREAVAEAVEKAVTYITDELTASNLEYRLNRLVDQRLKEKLNLK